jgi:hypothetical protein
MGHRATGHEGEQVGERLEPFAHAGHQMLDAPGDTLPGHLGAGSQLDDERAGWVQSAGVVVGFPRHAAVTYPETSAKSSENRGSSLKVDVKRAVACPN